MKPQDYAREYTKAAGSNFYYSFLLLPKPKRDAMFAVYAFCKYTDDLVDEDQNGADKKALLDDWRLEIERLYQGRPLHPITQSLANSLEQFHIPQNYLNDLVDGMEMDLNQSRYRTFDELLLYCYRVASVVGLMSIEIFGYSSEKTKQYAKDLGIAFQLTNIIRDIKCDAEIGRIYIPQEDLNRFDCTEVDLKAGRLSRAVNDLISFQVVRAKEYFQRAAANLPLIDRSAMLTAEIMANIYFRILEKVERAHYDVFSGKISLSKAVKLGIALSMWAHNKLTNSLNKSCILP